MQLSCIFVFWLHTNLCIFLSFSYTMQALKDKYTPHTHSKAHIMWWPLVIQYILSWCGPRGTEIYDACLHNQFWIQNSVERLTKRRVCMCVARPTERLYISAHQNDKCLTHDELHIMHPHSDCLKKNCMNTK